MRRRPPLAEVWHWSWFDKRWTLPFGWWLAWDATAIPVGGSDWHRPGSDAPPGCPTTWVECAGPDPGDVLAGLRAGRVAISAERDGPVLLRHDGYLVAIDADGNVCVATILNGGITIFSPKGDYRHVATDDFLTTNICFGGRELRTAFITLSSTGRLVACDWERPGLRLPFNL